MRRCHATGYWYSPGWKAYLKRLQRPPSAAGPAAAAPSAAHGGGSHAPSQDAAASSGGSGPATFVATRVAGSRRLDRWASVSRSGRRRASAVGLSRFRICILYASMTGNTARYAHGIVRLLHGATDEPSREDGPGHRGHSGNGTVNGGRSPSATVVLARALNLEDFEEDSW